MRIISFMWFKQNCMHLDRDYDFSVDKCEIKRTEGLKKAQWMDLKWEYTPCNEKHCPILKNCKKI